MRVSHTLLLSFVLTFAGCASDLGVHKFDDSKIDVKDKTLVILGESPWTNSLRVELAKYGFKIKKFASRQSIRKNVITETPKGVTEDERTYQDAEARYGITLTQGRLLDYCPFNSNIKADFSIEVTDLIKNEVVMVIQKGNWTGICGPFSVRSKYIMEELAEEFAAKWM